MKVLLLEPYTGMRVMMRGIFKMMGVEELYEPRTSLEAMRVLVHDSVDFFICSDTVKPLDALLCIKLIRSASEEHIRQIRTLVSVDHYSDEEIKDVMNAGCDVILKRPFSVDDVTARIQRLIRKRAGFIECKAYIGPDRRKWEVDFKHEERRDDGVNPGKAVCRYTLSKLIQRLFNLQEQKKLDKASEHEEVLLQRGILLDEKNDDMSERQVRMDGLSEGMILVKPIQAKTGMLVLPAGHTLGTKSINRLKDLVSYARIDDGFSVCFKK